MTDREALYRAVLANPDDDTLRLIYADAIEEDGDSRRAAFIRTQVGLAGVPEYDPASVRARWAGLFRPVGEWIMDLPGLPDGLEWTREPCRRGFPASIHASDAMAFVANADDLFARLPIESLELSVARLTEVREFANCPWVSRLVRLSVMQGVGGQAASLLLDSTHYERLRELHIGAGLTTATAAIAIVRSRVFRRLTSLSCRADRAGGQTLVNELIGMTEPPRLKNLGLSGNRLTAQQLGPLLRSPALTAVEELDLSDNNLGPVAVRTLAATQMPQLRSLRLQRTRPEDDGVSALATAGFLGELRSLSLGGNILPAASAAVLAGTPGIANLRVLDLRENRLRDAGAIALADSPYMRNLVQLDLASNLIEDDGAEALAASPNLGGLIYLDLHENAISSAAAARLKRRFGERVFL